MRLCPNNVDPSEVDHLDRTVFSTCRRASGKITSIYNGSNPPLFLVLLSIALVTTMRKDNTKKNPEIKKTHFGLGTTNPIHLHSIHLEPESPQQPVCSHYECHLPIVSV